jgi:hypothetical protein
MSNLTRLILPTLILLAASACQGATPGGTTPVASQSADSTPAGFVLASIEGNVWHDLCDSGADGEPALTQTPPGCVQEDSALFRYHADGVRQPAEPGLAGVTLSLAAGACPGGDVLQDVISDTNGAYRFSGLNAGAYCVSIDPSSTANEALFVPGEWTHPQVQEGGAALDVNLHAGESMAGVDFGWDEQFYPHHVHLAEFDGQGQLQVVDTGAALDDQALPTAGLMPHGGVVQGQVYAYAFDSFHPTPAVLTTTPDGLYQVDFIQKPDNNLAVWPGNGERPAMLAWSVAPQGEGGEATLFVSDLQGAGSHAVYSEPLQATFPSHLLVQGWSSDGQSLLFSREPWGIGGFIPFGGASSLYRLNLADGQVTALVEWTPQGSTGLCLDAMSPDASRVVSHCPRGQISVINLDGSQGTTIAMPEGQTQDYLLGSALFNGSGTRIAYASAAGNPDQVNGWVAVADGLSGGSHVILATPSGFYRVIAWLNDQTLLLQGLSVPCGDGCAGNSLWTVGVDGSGLTQIAQGDFITLTNAGRP